MARGSARRRVVDRFLEHSRIYYFRAGGTEKVYLSSADWMDRNFFRRIEVCFPILDNKLRKRVIKEGLKTYLADNFQTWEMESDGSYRRKKSRRGVTVCAQQALLLELSGKQSHDNSDRNGA